MHFLPLRLFNKYLKSDFLGRIQPMFSLGVCNEVLVYNVHGVCKKVNVRGEYIILYTATLAPNLFITLEKKRISKL